MRFENMLCDPNSFVELGKRECCGLVERKKNHKLDIGDGENDVEFLQVAGLKVAVNNAASELKAMADYVTHKPYGDGVAEAVYKFILN